MIYDKISNLALYAACAPGLAKACAYIASLDLSAVPEGEFSVDGKNIFGFCKHFSLKDDEKARYEAHREYLDIQLVLGGSERILCADTDKLTPACGYDAQKDICFFENAAPAAQCVLSPGDFMIFFPGDAHKPCCKAPGSEQSYKMVVKVRLQEK